MISAQSRIKQPPAATPDAVGSTPLPRVLRSFWIASAVVFFLTIVIAYLQWHSGMQMGRWDPLLYPFFADLLEYPPTYRLLHTAAFFHNPTTSPVAYPPFGAVQFAFLYSFGRPVAFYLAIATIALSIGIGGVRSAMIRYGIKRSTAILFPLTLVLISFPIARLVPQGNLELFLWIFAAGGSWAFLRGHDDAAAVLWALAAATKLYPIIFLVLLLPRQKIRAFCVGIATFVAASVLSMAYLGPTIAIAWAGSLDNVFGYQGVRVAEWSLHELAGNHSLFTLVKLVATVTGTPSTSLVLPYYLCGALLFAGVFFGRLRKMPVANQLLAVSVFMILLPPISYFHTLVHLYAPWLVLIFVAIRADRSHVRIPGLDTAILLFVPLSASFTLFTFPTYFLFFGLLQAVLLVFLFLYAVQYPFPETLSTQTSTL